MPLMLCHVPSTFWNSYLSMYVPLKLNVKAPMAVDGKRQRASTSKPATLVSPRLRFLWSILMMGPGQPGQAASGAPRVTRNTNRAGSARRAAGVTPKTMVLRTSTDQKSTPTEMFVVGSKTMPTVRLSDSSGLRAVLPPSVIGNCVLQSIGLGVVVGQ